MKKLKIIWRNDIWLRILTITSILLIVGAFFVPPLAVIDGSILAAVGELAGFGAIWEVNKAIDKGVDASVKHNDTEIQVKNPDNELHQMETLHTGGDD